MPVDRAQLDAAAYRQVIALAQHDPASPLLPDAVRYLMAYRDAEGGWGSSYTTAWAMMSMTEVMRGTGELGGEFTFSAELNQQAFATGEAGGAQQFVPVFAEVGIESLLDESPNALNIFRDPGTGRLYYRASLQIAQPVESVEPLNRGLKQAALTAGADAFVVKGDPPDQLLTTFRAVRKDIQSTLSALPDSNDTDHGLTAHGS